ncbi:unnamed protein product [Urochloa decumbens]|uniref:Chlorophyllase n=1 Tax=Urochloa decumbens TaxID=240449 RepID=A0ABC8VIH2_9POAL
MAASAEVMNPSTEVLEAAVTSVFQPGNHAVELIQADGETAPKPPMPILVAAPKIAGTYPVAMFLHGFFLQSHFYEQVLKHCASFGFIMVAPQLQVSILTPTSSDEDIASASKVTDWLTEGLPSVLPEGVNPDVSKLALAGHSRGAHTAFSLALGYGKTNGLKFSALIGIDPVAGQDKSSQVSPKILTYEPSSFNIAMPVLVIGTGLGEQKRYEFLPGPACAPRDVNHREFYRECKPPCYHLVTRDYGHLDMLDDEYVALLFRYLCKEGKNRKDTMRRSVAGIMVAFLKAVLSGEDGELMVILKDPGLAPATLNPVECRLA